MKKKLLSIIVTLVLAVSLFVGVAVLANAEETDGLKNTALNLAENVTLYMEVAIAAPEDGAYAKITLPNGSIDTTQLVAKASQNNAENYIFTAKIAAKELSDAVKIEICKADGTTLVAEQSTTALDYCENYLSTNEDGEFVDFVGALKAYANAAKYYFDKTISAESANTADLESVPVATVSGNLPAGLTHRSATLLLESETTVRHYFELAEGKKITDYTFFVDLDNDGKCDPMEKLTAGSKTDTSGKTVYYVDIKGITPNELDIAYTLVVKDAENTYTCTYGVLQYLKNINKETASNDTKNLVYALYNYNVEAAKLKGEITYVTDGSAVEPGVYEYGVTTPLVSVSEKSGYDFIGWYDEDGNHVTSITPDKTGNKTLTAKFAPSFSKVLYDASAQSSGSRFYCQNHVDTTEDGEDKCDNCDYCVANTACTIYNPKSKDATACATCGQKGAGSSDKSLGGFASSISDIGNGYAEKITLENGKEVMLFGKANTFYNGFGDNIATTIGAADSSKIYAFSIEVGIPDESIYGRYEIAPSKNFGTSFPQIMFRTYAYEGAITNSTTTGYKRTEYSNFFEVTTGKYAKLINTQSDYQISAVNDVEKLTFVLDFSDSANIVDDNVNDKAKIYILNEAGHIVYSGEKTFSNDISEFVYAGYQLRFQQTGRVLLGDFTQQMFNNYFVSSDNAMMLPYTVGEETPLPEHPGKDGYLFLGWYADEELTVPIDSIPANASGKFTAYPKWAKAISATDWDNEAYTESFLINSANYCKGTNIDHVDANNDNICDNCIRCVAHVDANNDNVCERCTYKTVRCGNKVDDHTDLLTKDGQGNIATDDLCDICGKAESDCTKEEHDYVDATNTKTDGICDICNRNKSTTYLNKPALGDFDCQIGSEYSVGYSKLIVEKDEEGNRVSSYLQIGFPSGDGPALYSTSQTSIATALADEKDKIVSYSFEFMAEEGAVISFTPRVRIDGSVFLYPIRFDGTKVTTNGKAALATLSTTEMTKFDVIVDFDKDQLRYYVNDKYVLTEAISGIVADYTQYGSPETGILQMRLSNSKNNNSIFNIGAIGIYIGDIHG